MTNYYIVTYKDGCNKFENHDNAVEFCNELAIDQGIDAHSLCEFNDYGFVKEIADANKIATWIAEMICDEQEHGTYAEQVRHTYNSTRGV